MHFCEGKAELFPLGENVFMFKFGMHLSLSESTLRRDNASVFIGPWAVQGETGVQHVQTEQAVHQLTSSFNKIVVAHKGATCFHLPSE
jgi:hypothetical protein